MDPDTGGQVTAAAEIRKVSLNYVKKLLTNREPSEDFIIDVEVKKYIHSIRMSNDESTDNIELSEENFSATFSYLASKPGSKYEFIMKAGNSLRPALFNLCKIVWETEKIPISWSNSRLIQLYKGNGPRSILNNHR